MPDKPPPIIPAPGEGKRGEAGYLGYLLRQAAGVHHTRSARALAEAGLTLPQFEVLTMLRAYPGISGADVARLTLLTPQTVNVIVNNLVRDGAVIRRAHEVHGRIKRLDVTPHGHALLAAARACLKTPAAELTQGLTEAEERLIRRWLADIARRLADD